MVIMSSLDKFLDFFFVRWVVLGGDNVLGQLVCGQLCQKNYSIGPEYLIFQDDEQV